MRCRACNVALTDYESTRKSVTTNEYVDLCNYCYRTVKDDLLCRDRIDLLSNSDIDNINDNYDDNEDY